MQYKCKFGGVAIQRFAVGRCDFNS